MQVCPISKEIEIAIEITIDIVYCRVENHVASIQMNRPEHHSALDYQLLEDLDADFTLAEDVVYAIVLSGAG